MPDPEDWYEVVTSTGDLEQGDLLADCPIPRVTGVTWPIDDGQHVGIELIDLDVIVLTQTCDLVSDKVDDVLVANVRTYQQMCATDGDVNPLIKGRQWRKSLHRGEHPPYCLLQYRATPPTAKWRIVDFHHMYSLPKPYLEQAALSQGDRLRLVAPYREHVAQSFARYMMRVGLTSTLHAFEKVEPA